jgi:YfiH family protein
LNCGRGSDDNPANVGRNLQIIAEAIGIAHEHILTQHQTHSDICTYVDKPWDENKARPQADALVTDQAGLAIGVLTADCAPVLFFGKKENGYPVIGAAHAGWKGAVYGVLDNTVNVMMQCGETLESLRACIGPCIAQGSYEVREAFMHPFEADDPANERFFMNGHREGHFMFDLAGYCAARLARCGLKNVFIKDLDTYFNEEDFFSYRRATHRDEKDYGRQISLIYIKNNI